MKVFYYLLMIISLVGCNMSSSNPASTKAKLATSNVSTNPLESVSNRAVEDLAKIAIDPVRIPRTVEADGQLKGTPSKSWTSGKGFSGRI